MSAVCIAIHDVAPATWPQCARLLDMLDGLHAGPVTLLVVPAYHRRGSIERDAAFVHALDRRLARGDELALHGDVHLDEAGAPATPREWFERRVLTASEGEFAALDFEETFDRLARGVALWNRLCWPLHGFVPPAWLLGPAAAQALGYFGFSYLTTRKRMVRLPDWAAVPTTTLCYSARSALRRRLSGALIDGSLAAAAHSRLVRIALHPIDAEHPHVMAHWSRVITGVLDRRTPTTKAEWMRHVFDTCAPLPPRRHAACTT